MGIVANLNINLNVNNITSAMNKASNDKSSNGFEDILNIGLKDSSVNKVDNSNIKSEKMYIKKTDANEANNLEGKKETTCDNKQVNENDKEDLKEKKKRQDCASGELLNMIMNTLSNDKIDLSEFIKVDEDMKISFIGEKIDDFIMQMQNIYEEEVGLSFDEVMGNITDILMDNQNVINETVNTIEQKEELVGMAIDFLEGKINELLLNQNNEVIEIDELSNQMHTNTDLVNQNDIQEISNDEVINDVKDLINELLGNVEHKEIKNKKEDENIQVIDTNVEVKENEEELNVVNEIEKTINEETKEDKSNIKDGKKENKDVKRININNNEFDYSLMNKNVEVNEEIQEVKVATFRENLRFDFAENVNVVKQTISGISLSIGENSQEMELKLNPENLGKINLKVATENGIVIAKFEAESQKVKEILESNLSLLKESLSERGIAVQSLEVSVGNNDSQNASNYDYERNANNSKNPHKIPRNGINKIVSIVDNSIRSKITRTSYAVGNNVNYIA